MHTLFEANWYTLHQTDQLNTPALVIYPQRVEHNIDQLLRMALSVDHLRPHVKTCKSSQVIQLMQKAGLYKFKCATIAEAELLGNCGATDVLLAYQPVGTNIERLMQLIARFPKTSFSCLVDTIDVAKQLHQCASKNQLILTVFIDVNVGMNRTGIAIDNVCQLSDQLVDFASLKLKGLHVYDGHIHDTDIAERQRKCTHYLTSLAQVQRQLESRLRRPLVLVIGGTPTFPIHAANPQMECSPGTFVFWDKGYEKFIEQPFLPAALVITRVVSIINKHLLCLDLGHKAIASENELHKRVCFLNAPTAKAVSQSEEHLVIAVHDTECYAIGDIFYGIPYHICPTVALYDEAIIVYPDQQLTHWTIEARKRKITI